MIRIKDLTVKNFMSVGNVSQAVDFNQEQLTLVLGENLDQGGDDSGSRNGTGKTTIINALSYALYGQALTNIKRNNLINKTNSKGMLVTLHFEKNGVDYRIERGRSPNIFKFFVDNKEQEMVDESQGDSRKTQEYVNELLGMSHDMFKHIVALNTYTEPFLSMRAADQRSIIEQLLGITILSEKSEKLKEEIKYTKERITEESAKITAIQSANEKISESIKNLGIKQRAWERKINEDIEKMNSGIAQLENIDIESEINAHKQNAEAKKQQDMFDALVKEERSVIKNFNRSQTILTELHLNLKDAEDGICHACKQKTAHLDTHADHILKLYAQVEEETKYNNEQADLMLEIENAKSNIAVPEKINTFYSSIDEAYEHKQNVDSLKQVLKSKKEERQNDPYQSQISELSETGIQEVDWSPVNDLTHYKEHQEFLLKLLTNKDSFVRKKIIDQNLAYLNNRLTYYLDKLGLPHMVVFQNDLSVEITQLGQDLDFDNLSRGERNRLILGMSFAFRDVWESLYQNVNLMFIDELVDSGMDASGVENALGVLKKMSRERNKNVFLISHKDELVGRVNHVMKVIKENGFTTYENDIDIVV